MYKTSVYMTGQTGQSFEIANSRIAVPVDMQRRYKFPVTLVYRSNTNTSGNTGDIELDASALEIIIKVSTFPSGNPNLSIYIEGKFESTGDYKIIASQTNITSSGTWFLTINPLIFKFIRVRWVITELSPSLTFIVAAQGMI